jgi:hypothetical protein
MKTMTSDEFKRAVTEDPAWASKLTEPVEITGACNMTGTYITHLSPLLHFAERSWWLKCRKLKVAEGNFRQHPDFSGSGIRKVGEMTFTPALDRKKPTALRCNLGYTPFFNKNPLKAAEIMTGSPDPEVWKKTSQESRNNGWEVVGATLDAAYKLSKKIQVIKQLNRQEIGPEI